MIIDHIFAYPDAQSPEYAEYVVFAVAFEQEDWEDMGVDKDSLEYNPLYLEKNEFLVFRAKLNDPLYLKKFYDENEVLLKAQYWHGVTRQIFVSETRSSWPDYYKDFETSCKERSIDTLFEPLSRKDAAIRALNEKRDGPHKMLRLKSKFGFIKGKVPFRLYAIEVDFDCYIITGGAIKIVEEMKQASNTKLELLKLDTVFKELRRAGITNKESLLDFIYERSSQADTNS